MRVSRKPGLRIPRKTITLKGERNGSQYIRISGYGIYTSGDYELALSLPVGTVVTLYAIGAADAGGSSESAIISVNEKTVMSGAKECSVRYVVVDDATIECGYNPDMDYSIHVAEANKETTWFTFDYKVYIARKDMTWGDWVKRLRYIDHTGNWMEEGFAIGTSSHTIRYNPGQQYMSPMYQVVDAKGNYIYPDDRIIAEHAYDHVTPEE